MGEEARRRWSRGRQHPAGVLREAVAQGWESCSGEQAEGVLRRWAARGRGHVVLGAGDQEASRAMCGRRPEPGSGHVPMEAPGAAPGDK